MKLTTPLLFVLLPAAITAHAFEIQPGNWQFPHQISWPSSNEYVKDTENMCIGETESRNYIRTEIQTLESDGCTVSQVKQSDTEASFRAVCGDDLFDFSYRKHNSDHLGVTQEIRHQNGKAYTIRGDMYRQGDTCADN
ncbi:hypothetical protein PL75_06320 [Neisseria arctica]|uniref:DUF3617 domain-containing protein n=1 Tax=Neisseria arctica TaxID=1470200 RepID=A0A0J0YS09_9NEIS|nr:DUF3617 family protein [Neisseria arctica]KLT72905.1 hypothetical protein PL75_06320 [Neisseria arctica]UOO86620.1 hypothetical protein LVJ86_10615 [Neisseria arctica]